jgi:hypothetical protein
MEYKRLTRRHFLSFSALASAAAILAGTGSLTACSEVSGPKESKPEGATGGKLLAKLARLVYHHNAVDDTTYDEIANLVAADEGLAGAIASARIALDSARTVDWLSLPDGEQTAMLREQQEESWFTALNTTIRTHTYNHPAVWEVIGYEGPSAHLGGYIHRGFDDIDWLPEVD